MGDNGRAHGTVLQQDDAVWSGKQSCNYTTDAAAFHSKITSSPLHRAVLRRMSGHC